MMFLDNQPTTLEKLSQTIEELTYRVYPPTNIVLEEIDVAGNLYFRTREDK